MRRLIKNICGIFILACFHVSLSGQATEQPNIIFILTDDHRYDMLGCTGNDIVQTPNIDQLAKDGILFTNAHVTSAICTPSRISILLSQFERKHGVNFNSGTSVADDAWEGSYPVVMGHNGYYTGYVGKNHSPIGQGGYSSGLIEKSFDYWYAGHGHLSFYPKSRHSIFHDAKSDTQVEVINEGVDDFFSNDRKLKGAQHFLSTRPKDQPFCLSVAFNLPHGAGTSSMKMLDTDSSIYRTLYRDVEIPLSEYYLEKKDIKSPKIPADIHFAEERQVGYDYVDEEAAVKERLIRSMQAVTGIDGLVGNLRKTLKQQGLDENTIIIFTSDHGLFFGEFGLGGKALCYEVTTHVPLIIYNPLASESAKGRVSDELVQSIDIAPTMLSYGNIDIPASFQGKALNGIVDGNATPVREYLFTENLWSTQFGNPRCESVQDKEWKYIRYYKNENLKASFKIDAAKLLGISQKDMLYSQHDPDIATYRSFIEGPLRGEEPVFEELFNLEDDPEETTNLAGKRKHRKRLQKLRTVWKEQIIMARGTEDPKVLRHTNDSKVEKDQVKESKNIKAKISTPPNVLLIVSDDQGWGDVGFNGGTDIPTPNLDALANSGVRFSAGYAAHPYCSPSRAALLSGRYQQRFGHENNTPYAQEDSDAGLPLDELLISELLKENEYNTAAIGKWHLGDAEKFWPSNRGFDDWFGFYGGGMSYWGDTRNKGPMRGVLRDGQPVPQDQLTYLTDDFSNKAVDYIDQYAKEENPFFMYLAYNAPHGPIQATEEYLKLMEHCEDGDRAAYGAMVAGMDVGIGKVIQKLKETGEYDNTLIIFFSDNGAHGNSASSEPYRGHKGMLFEGGIRVPFLMSWPNGITNSETYNKSISALDIYPTILAASGISYPNVEKLDGVNLLPYINSDKKEVPHEALFWRYSDGEGYAALKGKYKMVRSAFKEDTFLFNLENDPYEHNNLANQLPDKLEELMTDYNNWEKDMISSKWSDPHMENVKKEESKRQRAIEKASAGQHN